MTPTLFTAQTLTDYLQLHHGQDAAAAVSEATATAVRTVVEGQLLDAMGVDDWPEQMATTDLPKRVKGWALELAAIAHENPSAAATDNTGQAQMSWTERRRESILERVRAWASTQPWKPEPGVPVVPSPTGTFPAPSRVSEVDDLTRRGRYDPIRETW